MVLGLLGFGVGISVLMVAATNGDSGGFLQSERGIIWSVNLSFMCAFWAIGASPLVMMLAGLARHLYSQGFRVLLRSLRSALPAALLYVLLVAFPIFVSSQLTRFHIATVPINHWYPLRISILSVLGGLILVIGLMDVYLIDAIARYELIGISGRPSISAASERDQIDLYLTLRGYLQRTLWLLATMIALETVNAGFLRNALAAWYHEAVYPAEFLWIFGGYFVALIALAYVPTYLAVTAGGRRIRDAPYDVFAASAETTDNYDKRRRWMNDVLGLNRTALADIRAGIALATPLAGTLVSVLFGR